jgi:hypothetical protein
MYLAAFPFPAPTSSTSRVSWTIVVWPSETLLRLPERRGGHTPRMPNERPLPTSPTPPIPGPDPLPPPDPTPPTEPDPVPPDTI